MKNRISEQAFHRFGFVVSKNGMLYLEKTNIATIIPAIPVNNKIFTIVCHIPTKKASETKADTVWVRWIGNNNKRYDDSKKFKI